MPDNLKQALEHYGKALERRIRAEQKSTKASLEASHARSAEKEALANLQALRDESLEPKV